MKLERLTNLLPSWKNALLAVLAAVLLILAFPDFDLWFLAWFALVPLLWAIEREKESTAHSCILGWIFGVIFFSGTCWWLTFAPITYAGFPPLLAYFLLFCVTAVAAIFPSLFAAILSLFLRQFGTWAFLLAPFVWVFAEFLRYWLAGNNWNALGYSQAFSGRFLALAGVGGVVLVSATTVIPSSVVVLISVLRTRLHENEDLRTSLRLLWRYSSIGWPIRRALGHGKEDKELARQPMDHGVTFYLFGTLIAAALALWFIAFFILGSTQTAGSSQNTEDSNLVAIQPNVPMSGMTEEKWNEYRRNHVRLAESALATIDEQRTTNNIPTTVVFPESPMNFAYETDAETQVFINGFAMKNNVSVLFNSAEPDLKNGKYYNSAVMVGPDGKEVVQYDKIYLLPFGEAVPFPLDGLLPGFVGNFSYGGEYDLFPLGDAKAGVMICFESHFGQLSREYVQNGADVIIEMTNDGYLGPTPVLRQHLANAVFRAVETNRPVLRVTNVGITAYISERGEVLDAAETYTEATRVWSVAKSDGSQTFYVKYGDWFAWLCSIITLTLLVFGLRRKHQQ